MKTFVIPPTNGTYQEADVTVTGTNTASDHYIKLAFSQFTAGKVAVQYKPDGKPWEPVGFAELTSPDVAEFYFSESDVTDWRFVVSGISGGGYIQMVDSGVDTQPGINSVSLNNAVVLTDAQYAATTPSDDVLYITTG